jgi:homopolymeric O-antigen transport system permease protein
MTTLRSPFYFYDVLTTLVGRELRIRYKGSMLGLLWAILSPLGTVVILHVLFTKILPLNIPHYPAFVYSGLLPWTWFQSAVLTGASTLMDNRDLVRKPFFPRPLLPAVVMTTNFMLYLLALPVLVVLLLGEGLRLSPALLLLPLVWLVQAIFTLACAVLVAALGVLIRDVQHLLGVGMLLWFYLTPIFYDVDRIAADKARWFALNPMAVIVQAHRAITLGGTGPDWAALGTWAVVGVGLLAASLFVFQALQDAFVEQV